ncbi:hypothetical protein BV898_15915 [Hypsibius exemplaris]|uniref:Chitin-binding type-2 domain-containing protein n=1 Tax=Hypsibius exemplaris TaxID=2072580 RepID=A0A9X6NDT1_HYPEX|nr:hypothetical protein BV898_15915 [Hypsibius exemplaris]
MQRCSSSCFSATAWMMIVMMIVMMMMMMGLEEVKALPEGHHRLESRPLNIQMPPPNQLQGHPLGPSYQVPPPSPQQQQQRQQTRNGAGQDVHVQPQLNQQWQGPLLQYGSEPMAAASSGPNMISASNSYDSYSSGSSYGGGGGGGGGNNYESNYGGDNYGFDCYGKKPAYYGDGNYDCKVYHVCQADGRSDTFYCPKWTRFNNYLGICDWHFKVDSYCNPLYKEESYGSSYGGGQKYSGGGGGGGY